MSGNLARGGARRRLPWTTSRLIRSSMPAVDTDDLPTPRRCPRFAVVHDGEEHVERTFRDGAPAEVAAAPCVPRRRIVYFERAAGSNPVAVRSPAPASTRTSGGVVSVWLSRV